MKRSDVLKKIQDLYKLELENKLIDDFNKVSADRDKYKKALEFYANPDNWHDGGYSTENIISNVDVEPANGELENSTRDYVAGKTAREVLKE